MVRLIHPGFTSIYKIYENALFITDAKDIQEKLHDSYDAIRSVRKDGTAYQQQLCKRLPSKPEEYHDEPDIILPPPADKIIEQKEEFVERTIGGIRLGKLDTYRKRYKQTGEMVCPKSLVDKMGEDPKLHDQFIAFMESE